jgi:hypothetical protein
MELKQVDREKLKTALDLTTWIVNQLHQKRYNKVAAYLATHQVCPLSAPTRCAGPRSLCNHKKIM